MTVPFAVVTDSTADIPSCLAAERQIYSAPMHIIWDNKNLRDGIDITSQVFYERLTQSQSTPTTSQPTLSEFAEIFQRARDETNAAAVLVLTISAKLSGTYNAARQAAQLVDFPVHAIDSQTGSLAHGLVALALSDIRDTGVDALTAIQQAQQLAAHTKMIFGLNTLEYLYRSGRVNNLQRLLGTALRIKPVLHVKEGGITLREQVRTRSRQIEHLHTIFDAVVDHNKPLRVGVLHGNAQEEMMAFVESIKARWQIDQLVTNTVCAPVGVHTGPGSLGFAILQ
ncbi:DegV family protein [Chloroflexota bacterium]